MGIGMVGWLVLLGLAAGAVAFAAGRGGLGREPRDEGAETTLRMRLAAGEIDEREFRERIAVLDHRGTVGASRARWWPIALLVAAAVVLLGLQMLGTGGSGDPPGSMMDGMTGMGRFGDHPRSMDGHMDHMTSRGATGRTAPYPDAVKVEIEAREMTFDPTTVEVTAGEPTNLTLANRGAVSHDLTIDEVRLRVAADSGESATVGVVIEAGEYSMYCSVPGHAAAGMRGTLTAVEPAA